MRPAGRTAPSRVGPQTTVSAAIQPCVYAERSIATPLFGVGLPTLDVTPLHTTSSLPVHTIDDDVIELRGLPGRDDRPRPDGRVVQLQLALAARHGKDRARPRHLPERVGSPAHGAGGTALQAPVAGVYVTTAAAAPVKSVYSTALPVQAVATRSFSFFLGTGAPFRLIGCAVSVPGVYETNVGV